MSLVDLEDDVLTLILSALDHVSVCWAQICSRRMHTIGQSQYVWRALYQIARAERSVLAPPTDWIAAYRSLNPKWDNVQFDIHTPHHPWLSLGRAPEGVGGQDPKLFPLGGDLFLVLAGAQFTEPRGGLIPINRADAHLAQLSSTDVSLTWTPVVIHGTPHTNLHGSYCAVFGDGIVADRIVCFGGGSHVAALDLVSVLDLKKLHTHAQATWTHVCGR
jgi:hypothetical protein